jgi:hypothetical protein
VYPHGGAKAAGSKAAGTTAAASPNPVNSTSKVQQPAQPMVDVSSDAQPQPALPAAEAGVNEQQEEAASSSNVSGDAPAQSIEEAIVEQEAFMPELPTNAITAEVVSGGRYPQLYSSDGHLLTHCSGKGDAATQPIIPAVRVPGAGWGDVVMIGLSWHKHQGDSSSGRLVSRLLYHHRVDNCRDPLVSSWEEVQRVVAGVCRDNQ